LQFAFTHLSFGVTYLFYRAPAAASGRVKTTRKDGVVSDSWW